MNTEDMDAKDELLNLITDQLSSIHAVLMDILEELKGLSR